MSNRRLVTCVPTSTGIAYSPSVRDVGDSRRGLLAFLIDLALWTGLGATGIARAFRDILLGQPGAETLFDVCELGSRGEVGVFHLVDTVIIQFFTSVGVANVAVVAASDRVVVPSVGRYRRPFPGGRGIL